MSLLLIILRPQWQQQPALASRARTAFISPSHNRTNTRNNANACLGCIDKHANDFVLDINGSSLRAIVLRRHARRRRNGASHLPNGICAFGKDCAKTVNLIRKSRQRIHRGTVRVEVE